MGLQEEVGLDVRVCEALLRELEWHTAGELTEDGVLLVPDGQRLILCCIGDDLHQAT